ncbi:hypothetical protein [Chitinophaga sp. RAB17]|uniref:hypothetical protein n=1 Tax=Chitinophaga sp. RAB17 TaxID=3233049 RepID=UPI003F934679
MKILLIVLALVTFSGCYNNPKSYDESRELVPNPEGYKKDTFIQVPQDTLQYLDTLRKTSGLESDTAVLNSYKI